jgi:hypothetical protein
VPPDAGTIAEFSLIGEGGFVKRGRRERINAEFAEDAEKSRDRRSTEKPAP